MTEVACIGQYSACVIRATRLDDDCTPLTGPTDGIVVAAIADLTLTPEVKERTFVEPEDACGNIVFQAEIDEKLKRYTVAFNLIVAGWEAIELLTDASLIIGGASSPWVGKSIGVNHPGLTTPSKPGAALELWVKASAAGQSGPCGADETNPKWVRHRLPRTLLRLDARTFNNETANYSFTGIATANPLFDDPYDDLPGVVDLNSPHQEFFDVGVPTVECGYVSAS